MRTRILVVAAAFAVGFVACGDDGPESPVTPSPATLTSLSIAGPAEVAPGTTNQYTATGHYSDGTTRDLTTGASWSSFPTAQLRHVGGGRFEASEVGDSRINVNSGGRFGSTTVLVIPPGTFKLSGTIRDASGPVENVVVEVISGTGTGLTTKSTFNGTYALFGVNGDVGLRVSAPGYTTQDLQVAVNGHGTRDLNIAPVSEPIDVSGNWTLTVTTSTACSDTWPAQARRREAAATVTQQGTRLTVRFPASAVFVYNNPARIAGTTFSMTLFYDDYYLSYGLTERIGPTEWLGVTGDFTGTATPTLITGEFVGSFAYFQAAANFPSGIPRTCAADRPFELRR